MARVGGGIGNDRHSDRQRKKQHTSWKFHHKFTMEEALAGLYPYSASRIGSSTLFARRLETPVGIRILENALMESAVH
jgi:hypothetical protein